MKKLLFLLTLGGISATVFMSVQGGAAGAANPGDRTGRVAATTTCKNCHSGTTYGNVTIVQEVKDASGTPVTSYVPGQTYTITLTTNKTAGTPVGYSFQWVAVKASDNATQAGTPTTTQASTVVHTLSARKYVEQSARMTTNVVTFTWVAPAAGTGSVKMYYVGMPVNGNNNDGATDTCSPSTSTTLTEYVATDRVEAANSTMKIMPNPVADVLRLQINTLKNGNYTVEVADLSGRTVATQTATLNDGENTLSLDAAQLASGIYAVRLLGANRIEATATMVKK